MKIVITENDRGALKFILYFPIKITRYYVENSEPFWDVYYNLSYPYSGISKHNHNIYKFENVLNRLEYFGFIVPEISYEELKIQKALGTKESIEYNFSEGARKFLKELVC